MRHILAGVLVVAGLAFTASAALAFDKSDYSDRTSTLIPQVQVVSGASQPASTVAAGQSAHESWLTIARGENMGR